MFLSTPAPAQEPILTWVPVSSGSRELAISESFDLDFQDFKESEPDVQFEPWEGGMFWAPRRGATALPVGEADFEAFEMGAVDRLTLSRDRVALCGGGAGAAPGTILVGRTSDARFFKASIDACGETLRFRWVTYDRRLVAVPRDPDILEAPVAASPGDDTTFDHEPRDLLLAWHAVAGAQSYKIEIDCQGCCAPRRELYCGEQENGSVFIARSAIPTSAYYTIWSGAYPGRWRTAAVGAGGKTGPWSAWRRFRFRR